nr:SET domain-containing protein 4 isoform X2 [Leptinotarsa decemlineata]
MGRTKRRRSKKVSHELSSTANYQSIICLQKWLARNGWKNNTKLALKYFPGTGRGLSSRLPIKTNDILITVPHDLMVTYATLKTHSEKLLACIDGKLTMHELLSLFLAFEKNRKGESFWRTYINSLPVTPPHLPWQATSEEMKSFPPDLRVISKTMQEHFQKSFDRVKKSIRKPLDCVQDENLFKWAYIMELLLDEPSIALCPFLDMFNHHFLANTEATVLKREGCGLVYQLKTLTTYKKHEQLFISYGSHDNVKLLTEYGFFIPGNIYDTVGFQLEEILSLLKIDFNQQEYKFLTQHGFFNDLYIGLDGLSYNLKALLYVASDGKTKNYGTVIFADTYSSDFDNSLTEAFKNLLHYKRCIFERDRANFRLFESTSEIAELMGSFIEYRLAFVDDLIGKFCV